MKRVAFVALVALGSVYKTSPEIFAQNLFLLAAIFYWTRAVILFNRLAFWLGGGGRKRQPKRRRQPVEMIDLPSWPFDITNAT